MTKPEDAAEASKPIVTRTAARTLYFVAAILAVVGLIVDVIHPFHWRVDSTAVGLIALLLVIPLVEQLRKLKLGGLEAEFEQRLGNIAERIVDISDQTTTAETGDPSRPVLPVIDSGVINRIVWVDDHPQDKTLELAELRRRFDVFQVSSTRRALAEVEKSAEETAVISDVARHEDGGLNSDAGLELLRELTTSHPTVPIYFYTDFESARARGSELESRGARFVTSSFNELAAQIRSDARASFTAAVGRILREAGSVKTPTSGAPDFVVTVGPRTRVGVMAKDYRRTPKTASLDGVTNELDRQTKAGELDWGVVVAPRDVFSPPQHAALVPRVQLVPIASLKATLTSLAEL